jgi:3-methyl-2-oxobutanoate hydroxymethyltransferase
MKESNFNLLSFAEIKKERCEKGARRSISMVTCYDSTFAKLVSRSKIDCLLVGDSVAMTIYGQTNTLKATPELIARHVQAVRLGAAQSFIVADLPFLAHRGSFDKTLVAVRRIMRAGANAIKIEGVDGSEETVERLVESGVPVMGHLGLTPQSVNAFGGFRVQGRSESAAKRIADQAKKLEKCGVFAIVLECVPTPLAENITSSLAIPTIGIGAGNGCDGQVLVLQDLLGLTSDFQPRFVRIFANLKETVIEALDRYHEDAQSGNFPNKNESYTFDSKV